MDIKQVHGIYWSATGVTRTAVEELAQNLARALRCPCQFTDITLPAQREHTLEFEPGDLVVVGSPTYAGKLPNKMLPFFRSLLKGKGAVAVGVVTYGNRSFDNALAELCAVLEENGFHTLAGAALVGRHSFTDKLAGDRPNQADKEQYRVFAAQIADQLQALTAPPAPVAVEGDAAAPYYVPKGIDGQPVKFLKASPVTDPALCTHCGICAAACPMGAVDSQDETLTPGICIKCQSCVRRCPTKAKSFTDPAFLSHLAMLEANFADKVRENHFFL